MYFFFQAEDGIRDGRVTGVQTCALPIYRRRNPTPRPRATCVGSVHGKSLGVAVWDYDGDGWPDIFVANDTVAGFRSEERRVGKECRSRLARQRWTKGKS